MSVTDTGPVRTEPRLAPRGIRSPAAQTWPAPSARPPASDPRRPARCTGTGTHPMFGLLAHLRSGARS